ncbi:hypothetical protein EI982_17620 [Haloplanus rallus]|uniref:Metalloenzyme n=1 Tax=Haloplanus rallus TaxID=1816183 RepID=A0A6B9F7M2_9EURY|nr:hypothetical protein [Haloplanus rallus]QGX96466.1 hypothetical protein EI982_17620 [Haloplanus rallus]
MDEDWDTLILLDACRYDMFAERTALEGTLESRISAGSTSEEFLDRNFGSGTFHDTVYVNTNPYLPKLGLDDDGTFHAVIDLLDDWDQDLETVHPETVVEAALDAHRRFPNKRLIVHFMQPHFPFIGETGRRIAAKGWSTEQGDGGGGEQAIDGRTVWQQLRAGTEGTELTHELAWEAYCENLEVVLDHVERLLDGIDGKTVVSADHGNMVGERLRPLPSRRKYGHYYGVYTPELVRVPWHVIESEERREIVAEPPVETGGQTDDVVEERLDALGYR